MKSEINNNRWIPSEMNEVYRNEEAGIEVFFSTEQNTAIYYSGKGMHHKNYYRYSSFERMEETIISWVLQMEKRHKAKLEEKQKEAEARKAFDINQHFKVGDYVYNSWGYEQTNIEFYKIIALSGKTLTVQEVYIKTVEGSEYSHGMADEVVASETLIPTAEPFKLRVKVDSQGRCYICARKSHYSFHKWDGRPLYRSWYY